MFEVIQGYRVERKKVKNINLRIKEDMSIYISAPLNLDKYYIEKFILSKKEWIEKHKRKIEEYIQKREVETYEENSNYKFLNKMYVIKILNSTNERVELDESIVKIFTSNNDADNIKKILKKYEYNVANKVFSDRLKKYAEYMNLNYDKLIINTIKGKWGYCNCKKRIIALNTNLIKRSLFEIDYVIVHELTHLVHPNHSKNFYDMVQRYFKDYKTAEKMLRI